MPRVRHHVSPQVYLPASRQHITPAWYPPPIESVQWDAFFANAERPSVLDIGCGRGGFLLDHALHHADVNILGLEVREVLVDWINGVINGEGLTNVRALWYTVANGLDWIDAASIDHVTYLFPDPWPKKRHHKRRLFSPDFLEVIDRVLKPDGRIYLATDVEEVDAYQRAVIADHGRFTISTVDREEWPFAFTTDQQRFCHRKDIPYTLMVAHR
jgi:tRNA (guanine-N7-)-methyltransferase